MARGSKNLSLSRQTNNLDDGSHEKTKEDELNIIWMICAQSENREENRNEQQTINGLAKKSSVFLIGKEGKKGVVCSANDKHNRKEI